MIEEIKNSIQMLMNECNEQTEFDANQFRYWLELHCINTTKDMRYHVMRYIRNLNLCYHRKEDYNWVYSIRYDAMLYWLKKHQSKS